MHDRIEHLVHGVQELFGGQLARRQRVSDGDPFGDDRVSVAVDELGDGDAVVPAIVLAKLRG
jgi:hypothetical protein